MHFVQFHYHFSKSIMKRVGILIVFDKELECSKTEFHTVPYKTILSVSEKHTTNLG